MHTQTTPIELACAWCGRWFIVPPSKAQTAHYCRKACYTEAAQYDDRQFWNRVARSGECWLWTGPVQHSGHGYVARNRWHRMAHRYAWELTYGPIPEGLSVLHRCDVPRCVRPDHLFLGTQADNLADMTAKGRRSAGERSGINTLTEDEVRRIRAMREDGAQLRDIAHAFGVTKQTVSRICRWELWRHVK